jgi:hypothetical protein
VDCHRADLRDFLPRRLRPLPGTRRPTRSHSSSRSRQVRS